MMDHIDRTDLSPQPPRSMRLPAEEPELGPWRAVPASIVIDAVFRRRAPGRATVVAIDGRGASGKTTLAQALTDAAATAGERAEVLHTDDVAWNHARLDWDRLLTEHVLTPAHDGQAVSWRPPAWIAHARPGSIEVPAATTVLLIEGTGAARRQLAPWIDVAVWVQADLDIAHDRGIARDCAARHRTCDEAEAAWDSWMTEELPHLADDRPWERADLIVAGTNITARAHDADIVLAERSPLLQWHPPAGAEPSRRNR